MRKINLLILTTAIFLVSCKISDINPNTETPVLRVRLSAASPSTEVIISWNKCEDAKGYGIVKTYEREGQLQTEPVYYISSDTTSYVDSKCEAGTEYTYTITAGYFSAKGIFYGRIFGDLMERTSSPKVITTQEDENVCLDYPKNIRITTVSDDNNALKISWDACAGATSYEFFTNDISSGDYVSMNIDSNESEYIMRHLRNESEYNFKLKAHGPNGKSSVLSAYQNGTVPDATNTEKANPLELQNNVLEQFYTNKENLWFLITPQEGKIIFRRFYDATSLMIFEYKENENPSDAKLADGNLDYEETDESVVWTMKNVVPGKKYLLRVYKPGMIDMTVK